MELGGWAISEELFEWIKENVDEGSVILELGSGAGTGELAKDYTMFSCLDYP